MAKFKKDGGKKKNKNSDFKKKVKVGRTIKKANETVPQVKVGRIIIKDQLTKLDDDFVKFSSRPEYDIAATPPPHASLLDIKKKVMSELKQCASDAKPADRKKFLQKVKRAIESTHYNLSSLLIKIVLEKICCPLMYDRNGEIRAEVPDLLRLIISQYTKANNINHGLFLVTSQTCPVLSVSLCRALSDSDCCLDALKVMNIVCDLCPKLVQSDSLNILCKLITILYRQTYFKVNHSAGEMKARNKFLDVDKLSSKCNSNILISWSLPRLIVDCSSFLLTRFARESLLNQISKVLLILSPMGGVRCDYLVHANNVMDDEVKSYFLAEICFEVLCAAWRDLISTATNGIDTILTFSSQSFNLSISILTCMKSTLEFVHNTCSSGKMFSNWLHSQLLDIFKESVGITFPYTVLRKSNKNNELDESSNVNKIISDIKNYFLEYDQ